MAFRLEKRQKVLSVSPSRNQSNGVMVNMTVEGKCHAMMLSLDEVDDLCAELVEILDSFEEGAEHG